MAASSRTSARSTGAGRADRLVGSTTPRVWTRPLVDGPAGPCGCGCALTPETSLGFAAETFAAEVLEMELLPWQRWLLIHALELLPSGEFRFRTIVLLVGRQNGKSTVLQILALWMMYIYGVKLVIGTAQNLDVAEEQWQGAVEIAEEIPDLAEEIEQVSRVNGKKFLKLRTRERYKVAAASRRGGRGLSGDLVLLDELREHQSWDAWAAVTKTTMARPYAMTWAASNAGDAASIVLRWLRRMAHAALGDPDGIIEDGEELAPDDDDVDPEEFDDDSLGIFEWSAPPDCRLTDRDGWCQSSPALGYLIGERAIRSAVKTDPEWVVRTEVLCQWMEGTREGPFPDDSWPTSLDEDSTIEEPAEPPFCVDMSWDRSVTHIGAAGWRDDGKAHVELVTSAPGSDWVVDWFTDPEHPNRLRHRVAVQAKRAPASSLIADLTEAGVDVVEWDGVEGTAELYDMVRSSVDHEDRAEDEGPRRELRHLRQPALDAAAANAVTRPVGDAWAWDRRKSPVDIAPLVSVTGALWCLLRHAPPKPSVYESRGILD